MTHADSATWAKERAQTGENLISLIECPHCKKEIAIYYKLDARVEPVPDTTDATPQLQLDLGGR